MAGKRNYRTTVTSRSRLGGCPPGFLREVGMAAGDMEVEAALEEKEVVEMVVEMVVEVAEGAMEGAVASEVIMGAVVEMDSKEANWVQLRESREPIISQVIDLFIKHTREMKDIETTPEQARLDRDSPRRLP
jgi:PII-like signaling protein